MHWNTCTLKLPETCWTNLLDLIPVASGPALLPDSCAWHFTEEQTGTFPVAPPFTASQGDLNIAAIMVVVWQK